MALTAFYILVYGVPGVLVLGGYLKQNTFLWTFGLIWYGVVLGMIIYGRLSRRQPKSTQDDSNSENELETEEGILNAALDIDVLLTQKPSCMGKPRAQTDDDRADMWTIEEFLEDPDHYAVLMTQRRY